MPGASPTVRAPLEPSYLAKRGGRTATSVHTSGAVIGGGTDAWQFQPPPHASPTVIDAHCLPHPSPRKPNAGFLLVCTLVALDLALTNIAVALLAVAIQQCIVATNPAFTVTIESIVRRKLAHPMIYFVIIFLCTGETCPCPLSTLTPKPKPQPYP